MPVQYQSAHRSSPPGAATPASSKSYENNRVTGSLTSLAGRPRRGRGPRAAGEMWLLAIWDFQIQEVWTYSTTKAKSRVKCRLSLPWIQVNTLHRQAMRSSCPLCKCRLASFSMSPRKRKSRRYPLSSRHPSCALSFREASGLKFRCQHFLDLITRAHASDFANVKRKSQGAFMS